MAVWCQDSNLSLNVSKIKELIMIVLGGVGVTSECKNRNALIGSPLPSVLFAWSRQDATSLATLSLLLPLSSPGN
jgi:hypothetical protein